MTCASMAESINVKRRCYWGEGSDSEVIGLAQFRIAWTGADGVERSRTEMFDGIELLRRPRGSIAMSVPIYTLPYEGHPGGCTVGWVDLRRTHDHEKDLEDVEARFYVIDNPHVLSAASSALITRSPGRSYPLTIEDEDTEG